MATWTLGDVGKTNPKRTQNEPKTNPNEPKCKKAKMNATTVLTKDYNEKWTMEDYAKRTQNEPKRTQFQTAVEKCY